MLQYSGVNSRFADFQNRALFRFVIPVILFFFLCLPVTHAQESDNKDIRIQWTGMERALELASESDKTIMIDVYAKWCSYCQRMQEEVYPNHQVKQLIRDYFIPVRVDVDSKEPLTYLGKPFTHQEFSRALEYRSTPTTYFMNEKGEVVGKQPGYLPVDVFSSLLEFVGSGAYQHQTYEEFNSNRN